MSGVKGTAAGNAENGAARGDDTGYPTTSWTVVRAAAGTDPAVARAALSAMMERYRGPVRAYLLHDGYTEAESDALAKRFFAELGGMLGSAADGKEPFRVWLLRALEQFLSSDPDPTEPPRPDLREGHASAATVDDSVERARAKSPPLGPKVSRGRRAWLLLCRHPLLVVGALLGALVLLAACWR